MTRETVQAMLAGATVTITVILAIRGLLRIKRRWDALESSVAINTGNNEWARRDLREIFRRLHALEEITPRDAAKGEG